MTTTNSNIFYPMLSIVGKAVWDSLENVDNWKFGDSGTKFTIVHKNSNMSLWVSNGRFFLDGYDTFVLGESPPKISLGLFERHIIWFRVSRVIKGLNRLEIKAKSGDEETIAKMLRGENA